ncbi:unnamed protein product [Lupinus luteus]|uniref:rRNA methyltransferase n=1 Tax=Lupinus luteus TaxID=3873 RepID=A0AAV1W476_LUPLU
MGKAKGKHRLDKYYHLAKEHGYRSRASWKLVQLNSKFRFLESAHAVLDLCAAPGGWMQVAVQRVPVDHLVIGVDLAPIAPIRGAVAIQEDITRTECKAKIKKLMSQHGCNAFDVILHDGSPNIGGAWAQEAMTQNALVIDAVKLATQFLAPKGIFVTKVFRSQDYSSVVYCLKQLFEKVEVDKPAASRSESAEIYVLGLKYKAPAKIDPRLLDFKHLFQGSSEPHYEDGNTTLRKISSAANFIWSDSPLEILGSVTSITFTDPADLQIKEHMWRIHIRKDLSPTQKPDSTTKAETEDEPKVDEDDRILNEMEELTNAMDRNKKRAKKLLAKRRAKDKARKATGMQMDAVEDGYVDHELFSLSAIKGKKDLAAVDTVEYEGDEGEAVDSDNEYEGPEHSSSDLEDSDEERKRYDEQMDEFLEGAYERFVVKKEGTAKQRKRVKKSYDAKNQLLEDDGVVQPKYDSDEDQADQEANPLVVPLNDGTEPTQEEITNRWFSQDVFAEAVEGDFEKNESEDEMDIDGHKDKQSTTITTKEKKSILKKAKENKTEAPAAALIDKPQSQASEAKDDFEIVPAPGTDSSDDSSSDESEDDTETKAEILACARKMLRKKQRELILDDAYNKYMFDDEGLPKWFLDEEKRHRIPVKPVTKEEIAAMRAQFKEIDARPAKKVAEAKARKKRVAMRKLEKVRKKANAISDQTEISDRSKSKQIEKLYKKATAPQRPKKEFVVAKKGVQVKTGKGKVLVDRRMKKDARTKGMGRGGKGGSKTKGKAPKGKAPSKGSARKGGRKGNSK